MSRACRRLRASYGPVFIVIVVTGSTSLNPNLVDSAQPPLSLPTCDVSGFTFHQEFSKVSFPSRVCVIPPPPAFLPRRHHHHRIVKLSREIVLEQDLRLRMKSNFEPIRHLIIHGVAAFSQRCKCRSHGTFSPF